MLYTLAQLSFLLQRNARTIYRAHQEYQVGKLHDTAEGRRLLFTEEEYEFLHHLFWSKRRTDIMKKKGVAEIIAALKEHPMNVYDLARYIHLSKSNVESLLVSMTIVFSELSEDENGVLYFGYCEE